MNTDNTNKIIVISCIVITTILSLADRICQILYISMTTFVSKTVFNTCLTFIFLLPATNIAMTIIYFITTNHDLKYKIKNFFSFLLYTELCYSPGANKSLQTQYEEMEPHNLSTYILTTQKVLNTFHIMFISLPQLLIITIHSSSVGNLKSIDIVSLIFTCLFIFWSISYYILCLTRENVFDEYLTETYA